jgi:hypothetical protein
MELVFIGGNSKYLIVESYPRIASKNKPYGSSYNTN